METVIQQLDIRDREPDTFLVRKAAKLLVRMKSVKPLADLGCASGVSFGRRITQSVAGLEKPIKLSIRNKERVVIMPVKQYEDILAIIETYPDLVDKAKEANLMRAADSYESLYSSITSSRSGTDALFSASADDINASYKPGETESA
ncbi:MAG: hypothetical protein F4X92_01790 [Gammaproteobacteria bacterium]|nr:hypothetical protein [Gammaproteobacteria bacterium]